MIVSTSVQIRDIARTWLGTPCLLVLLLCPPLHALQRVTLRNGFSYDCARYRTLDRSHIRLYLYPHSADFIDILTRKVASIETLPDPPLQPAPTPAPPTSAPMADVPQMLSTAGRQHHIDVALLASIVQAESDGHTHAVSPAGAQGLMQLMPGTAHQLGVHDAFRPDQNIAGGATYLDQLLDRYDANNDTHGLVLALAAYNAGPAAVDRYHGVPPYRETRVYVMRVLNEFTRRERAAERAAGRDSAPPSPHQTLASLSSR